MKIRKILTRAAAFAAGVCIFTVCASASAAGIGCKTEEYIFENKLTASESFSGGGVFNAEILSDGTYTASLSADKAEKWLSVTLLTDIPHNAYPDLSVTIDSFTADGEVLVSGVTYDNDTSSFNPMLSIDENSGYYKINLVSKGSDGLLITAPESREIKITFTVSGYGEAAPTVENPAVPVPDTGVNGISGLIGGCLISGTAVILAKKRK